MILSLYRGLTTLAAPLISRYLQKRLAKGKEHPIRFPERLGQASLPRPEGPLVWLHGASVGEAVSLLPLIDRIRDAYPTYTVLMTTGTVTSAALMEKRLPKGVIHQFIPVDRLPFVRGFLDHWKPSLAIWAESELWPNLICETKKRNIKMALVNARMSANSEKNWQRFPGLIKTLLGSFDMCLTQTDADEMRYRKFGTPNVDSIGNLKYASPALPADEDELSALQASIGTRPLWLAASTHPGEEALCGRLHQGLKSTFSDVLTIIAPRHPERGNAITAELRAMSLNVAQRSKSEQPTAETDVYLCDTLGDMGLLYRLNDVVFIGKSLEPLGGQNPLEPARLDCAIICGPYMTNFAEIMTHFESHNAVIIAQDEADVGDKIAHLLSHPDEITSYSTRAQTVAQSQAAILDKTMDKLAPFFDGTAR